MAKRIYKRITQQTISRFKAEQLIQGNGTAAVTILEPEQLDPSSRAHKIAKKDQQLAPDEYVEASIEQIAVKAINRIERIVDSEDEHVALKASTFVIEQRRGKATQKTENKNYNLNIQAVLE